MLDLWKDDVHDVDATLNRVFGDPKWMSHADHSDLEQEYWHGCALHINDQAKYRRAVDQLGIVTAITLWQPGIFKPYVVRCDDRHCTDCGRKLTRRACSCGVVSAVFEEDEQPVFSPYRPSQRFKKVLARLCRRARVRLLDDEFKAMIAAYELLLDRHSQRGTGSLLNVWYVVRKLASQLVTEGRSALLSVIRLTDSAQTLARWDRRYAALVADIDCLNYTPTTLHSDVPPPWARKKYRDMYNWRAVELSTK
jgi:hypothetical protein